VCEGGGGGVYVCMLGRGRTQTSIQDGWVKTRRNAINNEFRKRKVGPFSKFFLQTQSALLTDNLHISSHPCPGLSCPAHGQ